MHADGRLNEEALLGVSTRIRLRKPSPIRMDDLLAKYVRDSAPLLQIRDPPSSILPSILAATQWPRH